MTTRNRERTIHPTGRPVPRASSLIGFLVIVTSAALAVEVPFAPQSTISTAADGATSVFAADVDGDGDMGALSASHDDNEIAWYENNGAVRNYGNRTGDWL